MNSILVFFLKIFYALTRKSISNEIEKEHVYKKESWMTDPKTGVATPGPSVVTKKIYITPSKMPIGIVIHYAASKTKPGSAAALMEYTKYGFHALGKTSGWRQPLNMPLKIYGSHVGEAKHKLFFRGSFKSFKSLSNRLLGVEVCCGGKLEKKDGKFYTWFGKEIPKENVRELKKDSTNWGPAGYYEKFTCNQERDLIDGCVWLCLNDKDFSYKNILGHHEVSGMKGLGRWRKSDPGGSLSMPMNEFRKLIRIRVDYILKK